MGDKGEEKNLFSWYGDGSYLVPGPLQTELIERSRKLDHIFNHSKDGMTLSNKEGALIEVNQACCDIFELDKDKVKDQKVGYHVAPEGRDTFDQMIATLRDSGYVVEKLPIILMNGKKKVIELSMTYKAYRELNLSIIRDITKEHDLFHKLMASKERLTSIYECALDGILIWKEDRSIIDANPAACELFNVSQEEISSYNLFDFLEGTNVAIGKTFQKELEDLGEIRGDIEFTMVGGGKKQLEFTSKKSVYGNIYMTIYRDITHRKEMVDELRQSEERFRKLFEGALDGMAILNHKGLIVDVNCAFCALFNVDYGTIMKTHYTELENNCEITWDNQEEFGRSGEGKRLNPETTQTQFFSFTISYNIYPDHHLTIIRDVTEMKIAEERLRKTETSNVLGDLAAGVAHEIRNPLSTVKGFLQLLDGNDSVNQELLKVVGVEMEQLEDVVNEFLLLSKREFTSFEQINMNDLIKEVIARLSTDASEAGIDIIEVYGHSNTQCVCIRSHIKQVLTNVIENGIQSMPEGGQLRVTLFANEEDEIVIQVEDEGMGISESIIERLGEPYYQTSEKGTGLGLMVCYKVVKDHGGHIAVSSVEGEGTTFRITLPSEAGMQVKSIDEARSE